MKELVDVQQRVRHCVTSLITQDPNASAHFQPPLIHNDKVKKTTAPIAMLMTEVLMSPSLLALLSLLKPNGSPCVLNVTRCCTVLFTQPPSAMLMPFRSSFKTTQSAKKLRCGHVHAERMPYRNIEEHVCLIIKTFKTGSIVRELVVWVGA